MNTRVLIGFAVLIIISNLLSILVATRLPSSPQLDVISTKGIIVRDQSGNRRIELSVSDDDIASIMIMNRQETPQITLRINKTDDAVILLEDPSQEHLTLVATFEDGIRQVAMVDRTKKTADVGLWAGPLSENYAGGLHIDTPDYRLAAFLGLDDLYNPKLNFLGEDESQLYVGMNDARPGFGFIDANSITRAQIGPISSDDEADSDQIIFRNNVGDVIERFAPSQNIEQDRNHPNETTE